MKVGARRVEMVMGTPVGIDIRTPLPPGELDQLLDLAFGWLRWVDGTFSTYKPGSRISRLARGEAIDVVDEASQEVSQVPEVLAHCAETSAIHGMLSCAETSAVCEVLTRCAEMREATGGYFDAYATGALDPSGYVKGWAAERVSRALSAAGAVDHCVNAGGDVRVQGCAGPGTAWRIGIRDPRADVVCKVVAAHDLAVATSASYARAGHIVDPHRARPVTEPGSVTVVGPDLAVADAYATALYAMGGAPGAGVPPAGGVRIPHHHGRRAGPQHADLRPSHGRPARRVTVTLRSAPTGTRHQPSCPGVLEQALDVNRHASGCLDRYSR